MNNLDIFTAHYVDALLWSETVQTEDGETISADMLSFSTAAADRCRADCLAFCQSNVSALASATNRADYSWADAGHDFALTRNGHGAGFWDRCQLPRGLRDTLTQASHDAGNVDLFLNDNGEVEFS